MGSDLLYLFGPPQDSVYLFIFQVVSYLLITGKDVTLNKIIDTFYGTYLLIMQPLVKFIHVSGILQLNFVSFYSKIKSYNARKYS